MCIIFDVLLIHILIVIVLHLLDINSLIGSMTCGTFNLMSLDM